MSACMDMKLLIESAQEINGFKKISGSLVKSQRPKMSLKKRLLSMLLCCVYCFTSLFCLHPNRNHCFSAGSRGLVPVIQQLYQRVIRLLRTTL
ncbi:hypothetical protein GBF38_019696 [Nibea albiflora]|uniref:Uncharacterized protein n=1 Tax=Nibea albiflora TaxID=240163 RepID=A0ACB7F297_NIBAL|nr:hypothetical protein GBF38_019696 [Nibea albiflora]